MITERIAVWQQGETSSGEVDYDLPQQVSDDTSELHCGRQNASTHQKLIYVFELGEQITHCQNVHTIRGPDTDRRHLLTILLLLLLLFIIFIILSLSEGKPIRKQSTGAA